MSAIQQVVACIRARGPLMKLEIAEALGWSNTKTAQVLHSARHAGLVHASRADRSGQVGRRRFIFAAVQQRDWPPTPISVNHALERSSEVLP